MRSSPVSCRPYLAPGQRFQRRWWAGPLMLVASIPLAPGCDRNNRGANGHEQVAAKQFVMGTVTGDGKVLADARVRFKGHGNHVLTDELGRFKLPLVASVLDGERTVTAAKPGYVIDGRPTAEHMLIPLRSVPDQDHDAYEWIDPTPDARAALNCGNCHLEIYEQWKSGAHARAADNRRFMNLYTGNDWHGRTSQGWGLLTEYPEGAGVCASCHAPAARIDQLGVADIRSVDQVARQGVHCDYCHKVQDVSVDALGLAHGRFASKVLRPAEGQLFFGPLDDVDRGEDSFLPLQSESRFCAGCHEGIVFGVPVYTTYSEWLASPARTEGKQCQSCHMKPDGEMTNIAPGVGGIPRRPMTLASHQLLPGGRLAMLKNCLNVDTTAERLGDSVRIDVRLKADDVGHRVPTGFIDRHLILVVQPLDRQGQTVSAEGPKLPNAAGEWADQPGVLFAKLLIDTNGRSPSPFWRAGATVRDTRLHPRIAEHFEFRVSELADRLRVRLLYRPFWQETSISKDWPESTLTVFDKTWPLAELLQEESTNR